jgi:hypothetical protein
LVACLQVYDHDTKQRITYINRPDAPPNAEQYA